MGEVRGGELDCLRSDKRLEIENFRSLVGLDFESDFFLEVVVVAAAAVLVPCRRSGISNPLSPTSLLFSITGGLEDVRRAGMKSNIAV
jgi:hypothetical protein